MLDARYDKKLSKPADLNCKIDYDDESDPLWLGNGKPAPGGMDLFPGCIVFLTVTAER